jgi:hypothetical protein
MPCITSAMWRSARSSDRRFFRGAGGEVEADHLRVWGQGVEVLALAPGGVVAPIGGVGALGCRGLGAAGIVAGGFGEVFQMGRELCRDRRSRKR